MDGLLLDTEQQALEGFVQACRANGVTPHLPTYYRCIGTRSRDSRQLMIDGHGPGFPFDDVVMAWSDYYGANFEHRPPPVKSGARVRAVFTLAKADIRPSGRILFTYDITLEIENSLKPALQAQWLTLMIVRPKD